ncbi:MAG: tetratricopeptide repeat protein [Desulfuromonadaceae bacterium]
MSKKEKLLNSAQKLLLKGQVPKAIKEYEQVLQLDPKDLRSRLKLAELYNRSQMSSKALEEYQKIGKYYTENGFYLKAIAVFKQAQRIDSSDPKLYLELADLNVKQGLVGNAMAEYRALIGLYESQQNFSEAVKVLQMMRDLEPENLNLRVKLAEAFARQDRKSEALEDFQAVLKILQSKKLPDKVLKLCEIFNRFFPGEDALSIARGQALLQQGQVSEGLSLLQPHADRLLDDGVAVRLLAQAYGKTGEYAKARDLYDRLLAQAPGDLDLLEEQVQVLLDAAEYGSALKILEASKTAFLEANRIPQLKAFYEYLREQLPEEERIVATLHTVSAAVGESVTSSPEPTVETVESTAVAESAIEVAPLDSDYELELTGETSAAETPEPAVEVPQEELEEEIPLEFLEEVHSGSEESPPEPEATEADSELLAEDLECALELELDSPFKDLSGDTGQVAAEPDALELDEEELSLSFDDDEEVLELTELDQLPDFEVEDDAGSEVAKETASTAVDVTARIEEAGFYLTQGLFDEARKVCGQLLEASPDCAEAQDLLQEIEARQAPESLAGGADQGDFFNFAEDVLSEIDALDEPDLSLPDQDDHCGQEEQGTQLKKGVDEQIDSDDTESHYNLGIAYREMGLINDAIAQFDQAMKDEGRRVDCLTLKGICLMDKKDFAKAEAAFKTALSSSKLEESQKISLLYEMGVLYELWDRPLDALDSFQSVADIDLFFRNVQEMIQQLRERLGMSSDTDESSDGGTGGKDRVSYI